VEFEQFDSFDVAIYIVCNTGIYLSTAALNKTKKTLQIHSGNLIVLAKEKFQRIQLFRLNNQTGLIYYGSNSYGIERYAFQIFQLTTTGKFYSKTLFNLTSFRRKRESDQAFKLLFYWKRH
jgi:hypothetical protein